jgi:hypothetical protein
MHQYNYLVRKIPFQIAVRFFGGTIVSNNNCTPLEIFNGLGGIMEHKRAQSGQERRVEADESVRLEEIQKIQTGE